MKAFFHAFLALVAIALVAWAATAVLGPSTAQFHAAESTNL